MAGPVIGPATPARAQDSMRIAAVVNEDAISVLDVVERTNLILATTGLTDNAETRRRILPQVLRTLIDESLQLQEAERRGFELDQINLGFAYGLVETNLGLPKGQLLDFLRHNRLSQATLDNQLRAEIAWNELVNQRMRDDEVSEEDIDEEMARLTATADETAYLLAEIFLTVDEPDREAEVEANLRRLREAIAQGANFPQLARQFSQSASAAQGGDLGWIAQSQLGEELTTAVTAIEPGEMSQPLRVIGGYSLVMLREKRQGMEIDPSDARIVMRQVVVPIVADESVDDARARARLISAELESCADYDSVQQDNPELRVTNAITVRMGELQPRFRNVLSDLPVATPSASIESDQGIHVVMVCERMEAESPLPTREEVRATLENIQFDLIARGYLRDLRRAAFVDVRI